MSTKVKDHTLSIRLMVAQKTALEVLAKARGVKLSTLARELLEAGLDVQALSEGVAE